MSLKGDLRDYLVGLASVSADIGTRLYAELAPASATAPYVVFTEVSTDHQHDLTSATGVATTVQQFDIYATTMASAESIAETLRTVLQGMVNATVGSTSVNGVRLEGRRSEPVGPAPGKEQPLAHVSMDFAINYNESIPTFPAS